MNGIQIRARGVIINDDNWLFCLRLKAYEGGVEHDYWCLPGGGVEPRESLESALHREMIEETGITPVIGELLYIQHFVFNEQEQIEFFFHVTNTQDFVDIDISSATHAAKEIAEWGFMKPTTTYILPSFLSKENIRGHIRDRQPTKIFSYL